MKQLCFGIIIMLSVWLFTACHGTTTNSKAANTDTITSADSLNALQDTITKSNDIDLGDAQFIKETASTAITEMTLGKLAQQKGENKRVKNFGVMMLKDLAKASNKLTIIAKNKNIPIPVAPLNSDQKTIDMLTKKTGNAFDEAYINNTIADHERYIKIFEYESTNAGDPDIKKFATRTLPALRNHLDAINIIHDSMKKK